MASLRSMILDGRYALAASLGEKPYSDEEAKAEFRRLERESVLLKSHDAILINAQQIHETLFDDKFEIVSCHLIPCPKPPYRHIWLEGKFSKGRFGSFVERWETDDAQFASLHDAKLTSLSELIAKDRPATIVTASYWIEKQGSGMAFGRLFYWLDQAGNFLNSIEFPLGLNFNGQMIASRDWILHTFARMNCHNVKLVPMTAGAPKIKKGKPHPPFSVWHEIVVASLPQLRREQKGEITPDGEKRELRFHKVRGHYADYTQGKGLFGKYKVRIWIEEHSAGEPELGTVVSSYTVQ